MIHGDVGDCFVIVLISHRYFQIFESFAVHVVAPFFGAYLVVLQNSGDHFWSKGITEMREFIIKDFVVTKSFVGKLLVNEYYGFSVLLMLVDISRSLDL